MIEVLQSMHLLLVKVFHFVRCYYLVVVEIDYFEPILYASYRCLVLLAEHEPHEIFIIHLVLCRALEFPRHLIEYTINSFS